MAYQEITFRLDQPCMVDLGDGQTSEYPAGEHTVQPKGYVIIENSDDLVGLTGIKFLSNTIREVNIERGTQLQTAEEMCDGLSNLERFNLQGENKIINFKKMLRGTSIKHLPPLWSSLGTEFDYILKDASRIHCIDAIDTTNQTSTVGMFVGTDLIDPDFATQLQIQNGLNYVNVNDCSDYTGPTVLENVTLSGDITVPDLSCTIITITNYKPYLTYDIQVDTGTVSRLDDKIYWEVPDVIGSVNGVLDIYSTDGALVSDTTQRIITITDTTFVPSTGMSFENGVGAGFTVFEVNDLWNNLA